MASSATKPTPEELRETLKLVKLISLREAARIMGMAAPNLNRLREQGRFPEPIVVIHNNAKNAQAGWGAYDKREVDAAARALARERKARARNGSG